jgi:putative endonuclease
MQSAYAPGQRRRPRISEASEVAYVYLLRCADGSLYCGWTTDPERRLRQHQAGTASRYTQRRRPVEYALLVPAADRSAALREEARIKKLSRTEKLALVRASA